MSSRTPLAILAALANISAVADRAPSACSSAAHRQGVGENCSQQGTQGIALQLCNMLGLCVCCCRGNKRLMRPVTFQSQRLPQSAAVGAVSAKKHGDGGIRLILELVHARHGSQQVAHGGKGWHTPVLLLEILRMCKRGPSGATRLLKDGCRDLKGHLALRQGQGGQFNRAGPACP